LKNTSPYACGLNLSFFLPIVFWLFETGALMQGSENQYAGSGNGWKHMQSILAALREGRLVELPGADKDKSVRHLASLIEAIPEFRSGFDFAGAVLERERAASTAIGEGWACPHGRAGGEGNLTCAIGWSPIGIEWAAPDSKPVHVVIMHYIPNSARNDYLKEISTLARAIKGDERMREFSVEKELSGAKKRLLDRLSAAQA
jgi:PTS system nitrogen regulatory IIA component